MGRASSKNVERRNVCRIFVGRPEGKSPLGERKYRWIGNM
jgi:hypothetical protein